MPRKLYIPSDEEDAKINKAIAEDPDTWEATEEDFARARIGRPPLSDPKIPVTIRLDSDVVAHFKASGKGWQTRINAALREVVKG